MKKLLSLLLILVGLITANADTRPAPEDRGISGLALTMRRLQTIASLLHTGAHPDDESTELLAYSARGLGARVAYLSLNRGEGGQNGIGPELWDGLGVIRTEELLAARKLDGAEQYFTRAFDFGFTRSAEETLSKWNREEVLGDIVRVIRTMRPLVVVTGFSGTTRDGHGQHQLAGMLTPEAIKAAADPARFPEQIKQGLEPWRVLKVYGRVFQQTQGAAAVFDAGRYDPILGRSYAELAADGRSRHRSQDFGIIQGRGSQVRSYPRLESSVTTTERETDMFGGIDVTIEGAAKFAGSQSGAVLPSLKKIQEAASRAASEFRADSPSKIAPYLATGLHEVRSLKNSLGSLDATSRANLQCILDRKEAEFSDALAKSFGVIVDALANSEIVSPGESFEVNTNVYLNLARNGESGGAQTKITLRAPSTWKIDPLGEADQGAPQGMRQRERPDEYSRAKVTLPINEPVSQPYWLARERTKEQYDWDATMPQTLPFAPPRLVAQVDVALAGENVQIIQPVEYRFADKTFGEIRRELKVAPAVTVDLRPGLLIVPAGAHDRTRDVAIEITHQARSPLKGDVKLLAPSGFQVTGDSRPVEFSRAGEKTARQFKVTVPEGSSGSFELQAVVEADGRKYTQGFTAIAYPHIETHYLYHEAKSRVEVFDVKVASGLEVGYVMGSGDDGPQALNQLGVKVKLIDELELRSGHLSKYDTIILGIRAYEVRDDVIANNKRLLDYVADGGTLIVQYNKTEFVRGNFAPYPVKMDGGTRVTDEKAPVEVLVPDHPRFRFPNVITPQDWNGWVQERGLYFLNEWDPRYTPLLSSVDEAGRKQSGGELIAKVGKGNYVFTAYAWFRQFPAGVPGAYRLFANLVSLPKAK